MQLDYDPSLSSPNLPLQTPTSPGYTPVSYGGWINPRVVTPAVSSIPPIVPPLKINATNNFRPPSINVEELLSQQRSLLRAQIHSLKSDVDRMPDDQYKKRALMQLADMKRQLNSIEIHPAHVHSEYEYDVQRAQAPPPSALQSSQHSFTPHTTATSHRVLNTPLPSSSHWVPAQPSPVPAHTAPATHTRELGAVTVTMPGGVSPSTPVPWHALPRVAAPVQHTEISVPQETVVAGTRILHAPQVQPPAHPPASTRESAAALAVIPNAVIPNTHAPARVVSSVPPTHPNASSLDTRAFASEEYSTSGKLIMDPAALRAVEAAADELAQRHARGPGHARPPAEGEPDLLHHAGADQSSPVPPRPAAALPLQRVARRTPHTGPYAGPSAPFATQPSVRAPASAPVPARVLTRRPTASTKPAQSAMRVPLVAPSATNIATTTFAAGPSPAAALPAAPQRPQTPQPRQAMIARVPRARAASTAARTSRQPASPAVSRETPTPVPAAAGAARATPLHRFTAAVLQRAHEQAGLTTPLAPRGTHCDAAPAAPAAVETVAAEPCSPPSPRPHPYHGPVAGQHQSRQPQVHAQPFPQPAQRGVGTMLWPTRAHTEPQGWAPRAALVPAPVAGVPAVSAAIGVTHTRAEAASPLSTLTPVSVNYDVSGRQLYQPGFMHPAPAPARAPAQALAAAPELSRRSSAHALPTARSQVAHGAQPPETAPAHAAGPRQALIVGAGAGGARGGAAPAQAVYMDANVRECGVTHGTVPLPPHLHTHPHAHTAMHAPARHSAAHAAATPGIVTAAGEEPQDDVAVLSRAEYLRAQVPRHDRNESSLVPHPSGKGLVGNYGHSAPADVLYDHVMQNMGHAPDAEHACLPVTQTAPYGHRLHAHGAAQPCADTVAPAHACTGGASHGLGVHAGTSASDYGSVYGDRYSVEAIEMARHHDSRPPLLATEAMFTCEIEDRNAHGLNAHQTPAALARRVLAQMRSHAPDTRYEFLDKHAPSNVADRRDLQMHPVRHHVKEEYIHPYTPHNVEGPYHAVDRFGRKSYVGAPVGTGDEHSAHLEKGRNKYGKKKVLAQACGEAGYESVVQPKIKSHRNNPHFKIYNRLQG